MILEEQYQFKSEDFDKEGLLVKNNETMFWQWVEARLNEFYEKHGKLFHPTTIICSGLTMKKLERSCQMDREYFFGIMTTNGKVNDTYNDAVIHKESRTQVVALSSNIKGHEDDPVYLYIDEELDNNTLVVKYRPEDDDDMDDNDLKIDPIDDDLDEEFEFIYGKNYWERVGQEVMNRLNND